MKAVRPLIRLLLALGALAAACGASAAEKPSSGISMTRALRDARELAASRADLSVVRVEGESMLPFFGSGSVLVVKKVAVEKLRAGMVVVYTNRFNETIAHRLVDSTGAGWMAAGYNNRAADSTPVTGANLLGVVYATFHTSAPDFSGATMLAADVAATPVALAAPAR